MRPSRLGQGIVVCIWPGNTILITPVQLHMHLQASCSAGKLPILCVIDPGVHGAAVAGMHGIGVSTPSAAAVAAATVGLAGELHTPNGMMLTSGM